VDIPAQIVDFGLSKSASIHSDPATVVGTYPLPCITLHYFALPCITVHRSGDFTGRSIDIHPSLPVRHAVLVCTKRLHHCTLHWGFYSEGCVYTQTLPCKVRCTWRIVSYMHGVSYMYLTGRVTLSRGAPLHRDDLIHGARGDRHDEPRTLG
jgi:hypothetical protein